MQTTNMALRPQAGSRVLQQRMNKIAVSTRRVVPPVSFSRSTAVVVRAGSGLAHPGEELRAEDYNNQSSFSQHFSPSMGVPNVTMAKGDMGSGSSMSQTMERKPLQFVMPTPVVSGPKLDDGGSGGDDGKHNRHGGGGGGGDDDDDDYFGSGDDDGEGGGDGGRERKWTLNLLRAVIPECYDKLSIQAVFAEWMRTVADLPLIIRRAVEMGLFSSAQLVRFFSMDVRPSVARSVSRNLPPTWAREFVGRLMADPGFAQKLLLESALAGSASMYYEYRLRGEQFKKELDLAAINSLGMAAATGATVWLLAPSQSYGSVHKFPWQQALDRLPNCVFDASGPLRQYTSAARVGGFFAKVAELSAVGALTGTVTSLASSAAVQLRRQSDPSFEPSTSVPSVERSAGGLATFFAANANVRYQLIGGLDSFLFSRSQFLWMYMGATGLARVASMGIGEMSRPWWQGLPEPSALPQRVRTKRVSKKVHRRVPKMALVAPGTAAAAASGTEEAASSVESATRAFDSAAAADSANSSTLRPSGLTTEIPDITSVAEPLSFAEEAVGAAPQRSSATAVSESAPTPVQL